MSNSKLATYTKWSPHCTKPRKGKIQGVAIHCMAGNLTVEQCGQVFQIRQASSHYGIGSDGRIAQYVDEANRAWCTSNEVDHKIVTIEVANSIAKDPWPITQKAYNSLIDLLVDICQRNGIKKLVWSSNKADRVGWKNGCNMMAHRDYAAKACLPVDTELLTPGGWIPLSEIELGDMVATPRLDDLDVTFSPVLDIVEPKLQDVYLNYGLSATKDHRMVYSIYSSPDNYLINTYNYLLSKCKTSFRIPLAGKNSFDGFEISDDKLRFIVALQADGHYMYDKKVNGEKSYYGVEFHVKKERKIKRIKSILEKLELPYRVTHQSDGSTKIRVYNTDCVDVKEYCEREGILKDKVFTWRMVCLNSEQAKVVLDEVCLWDGSTDVNAYFSCDRQNLDVINALAALNGVGSRISYNGNGVGFRETAYQSIGEETIRKAHRNKNYVSCVTVATGLILIRQKGKTFIVGNCPGDYIYSRENIIADTVNKRLNGETVVAKTETTASYSYKVKVKADLLNVRSGPGITNKVTAQVRSGEVYTITGEKDGWGKLKSGVGWVSLKYTEKV